MAMPIKYDIIVAGGGLAGLTQAALLAQAGFTVACIEQQTLDSLNAPQADGRTTALSAGSRAIMAPLGIWPALEKFACPILDIRIADSYAPLFLHFAHDEVGAEPFGWIVENWRLRQVLAQRAQSFKNLTLLTPRRVAGFTVEQQQVLATLDNGQQVPANLLIAADGRHSFVRAQAGITVKGADYWQSAIVCVIQHELPHHNIAIEHFLPDGPFASLPMVEDSAGRHRSSVVWTKTRAQCDAIAKLSATEFNSLLQQALGNCFGAVSVTGPRFSYPLRLQHAQRYYADRVALINEAAHVIHPIAGQGLNVGLRDIAQLTALLTKARNVGLDIGSTTLLARYHRARLLDSLSMAAATDGLDRLFSNNINVIAAARRFGLQRVAQIKPLKRFFMRHAMGRLG